jgi:hypothetical protein
MQEGDAPMADSKAERDERAIWRYTGGGESHPGIPPRDLTAKQFDRLSDTNQDIVRASSLYVEATGDDEDEGGAGAGALIPRPFPGDAPQPDAPVANPEDVAPGFENLPRGTKPNPNPSRERLATNAGSPAAPGLVNQPDPAPPARQAIPTGEHPGQPDPPRKAKLPTN